MPDYRKDILTLLNTKPFERTNLRPLLDSYINGLPEYDADRIREQMKSVCYQLEQKKLIKMHVDVDGSITGKRNGLHATGPIWSTVELDGEEYYANRYGMSNQSNSSPTNDETEPKIEKASCPTCNRDVNVTVRAEHTKRWEHPEHPIYGRKEFRVLECNGCENLFFQSLDFFSEDEEFYYDGKGNTQIREHPTIKYYPELSARIKPDWLDDLEDELLKNILHEIYSANNHNLLVLTAIGLRTAFDRASTILNVDADESFKGKLSTLLTEKLINNLQEESLDTLVEAGNAAAHRSWLPKHKNIDQLLSLLENFLHHAFIIHTQIKDIGSAIPARNKKKNFSPDILKSTNDEQT